VREQTVGLLRRRHIRLEQIKYIGKESNSLVEVESGLIHSAQSVYTEYPDPRRDTWQTKILPALRRVPLKQLVRVSGMSSSALKEMWSGRSRPHPRNQKILAPLWRNIEQKRKRVRVSYAVQRSGTQETVGTGTSDRAKRRTE